MITGPLFIFFNGQMAVTGRAKIARKSFSPSDLETLEVFDGSGQRLEISTHAQEIIFSQPLAPAQDAPLLKEKILVFLESSGLGLPAGAMLDLPSVVQAALSAMKAREWKTYHRGTRMFWTLMLPCGILPFVFGFLKISMDTKALRIYSALFLGSMSTLFLVHRALYPRPQFPDPSKK